LTIKTTQVKLSRAIEQGVRKAAREIAQTLPKIVRDRVRAGFGLSGRLKSLSDGYIKFRTRAARRLSKETSPGKSNLTATGQMLNAIIGQATGSIVRIFMKDTRKRELSGGATKTNNEVRRYAEEDRPFFELTRNERAMAEKKAAEIIKQELRRVLK
jgi:hypothetical protein